MSQFLTVLICNVRCRDLTIEGGMTNICVIWTLKYILHISVNKFSFLHKNIFIKLGSLYLISTFFLSPQINSVSTSFRCTHFKKGIYLILTVVLLLKVLKIVTLVTLVIFLII